MKITGEERLPGYLFITHSHWDHCGSMPYLKRSIPGLQVCGHHSIPALLKKESVIKHIRLFNEMIIDDSKTGNPEGMKFDFTEFDMTLREGDTIDLGDARCIAYETPGHTKDSMSYYIPEYGILFPGEAIGVPEGKDGEGVQVEFLNSYSDYLNSIRRLADLKPEIICMAHEWVFTGSDAARYLERSYKETISYRDRILQYLNGADGEIDAAVEMMARKEYDEKGTYYQPRFAYVANLQVQVKHIAGDCKQGLAG